MYARKLSLRKFIVAMLVVATFGCLQPMTNAQAQSMWVHNGNGWWYQNADGSYPANVWQQIDGQYYYFNGSGYMVSNCWIGNYYLGGNGAMLKNTTTPDGYQVDENGKWIPTSGWKKNGTGWWYQNADGSYPVSAWQQIDGQYYYFNGSGYMVSNCWIGNYYLGGNGAMLKNTTTPDGYQVDENGKWIPAETNYGGGATWGSSSDSEAHVSTGSGAGAFNPSDPAYLHADGKIIGNVKSRIYHWPGSRSYKRVSMANAEFFDSADDAEAAGYRAARR